MHSFPLALGLVGVAVVHAGALVLACHVCGGSGWPAAIWCCVALALYGIHRVGHSSRASEAWYRAHTLGHHDRAYPATRFLSDTYVVNDLDDLQLNTFLYTSAGLLIWGALSLVAADARVAVVSLLHLLVCGLGETVLHEHFHLRHSWLERYAWFQALRHLHELHHRGRMRANFAMSTWFVDALCGTLALK
jgi:hypothetical protein